MNWRMGLLRWGLFMGPPDDAGGTGGGAPPPPPKPANDDAKVKALEDQVAQLSRQLEEAKRAKDGSNIVPASESSVHALRDELKAVKEELARVTSSRPERVRWVPG